MPSDQALDRLRPVHAPADTPGPDPLQRSQGKLHVAVKRSGAETVLRDLHQAGCLKARFPRRTVPGWMDIVTLNTGGGVAGGDRLDISIAVGTGAQASVATQAAERFYRARAADRPSQVRTRLTVGSGGALEWLPQETILFDQSALDRSLQVDVAADGRFLGVETLVFGRGAMGEQVRQGALRDLIRVRHAGRLLLHEPIRMAGDLYATLQRPAVAAGASVAATMLYLAPDAVTKLEPVRAVIGPAQAGASVWNGLMVVRLLGTTSAQVRTTMVAVLDVLREARPLPRVWLC